MCPPVLQQLAAQLTGDQDRADFPLQRHLRPAAAGGLHGQGYFTSLTRIPVEQMASMSRPRRSRPSPRAAESRRPYSARLSSRSGAKKAAAGAAVV